MKVVCAYCNGVIAEGPEAWPDQPETVSHGICAFCELKSPAELEALAEARNVERSQRELADVFLLSQRTIDVLGPATKGLFRRGRLL